MAGGQLRHVLCHIRSLVGAAPAEDASDRALLARFAADRDQAAFAEVVRRHGPLVWGVCRRLLRHEQDTEDAFQATFLVLARKAGAGGWQSSVAGWLYETARRTAQKARAAVARRLTREREAQTMRPIQPDTETNAEELHETLSLELARLPPRYREPLLLCALEGLTTEEAARRLRCPTGTVKSRLARGREHLRAMLLRRGVALSAAGLAGLLTQEAVAAPPRLLAESTITAALAAAAGQVGTSAAAVLAREVSKTLPAFPLKIAVGVLLAIGVVCGYQLAAPNPQPAAEVGEPNVENRKPPTDLHGDPLPDGVLARLGTLRWRARGEVQTISFTPEGKSIAAVTNRGLCLFDVATGKQTQHVSPPDTWAKDIVYSPGGTRFACCCSLREEDRAKGIIRHHEVVQIWETKGPRKLRQIDTEQAQWLGWSGDNQLLMASREESAILLHEILSGQVRRLKAKDLPPAVQGIHYCTHSPAGNVFAAPGESNKVHVWDTATGEERRTLQVKGDYSRGLAFSPAGRLLATYSRDAAVRDYIELWDMTTGKVTHTVAGDQKYLDAVAFSPDGKTLATIGWNDVRFFDAASGRERSRAQGVANFGQRVAFAPDSKTLATTERYSGTLHLWDVDSGKLKPEPAGHTNACYVVTFSPDGRRVATKGAEDHALIVWDPTNGKQFFRLSSIPSYSLSRAFVFSPDGDTLCLSWDDGKLMLLDGISGRERRVVKLDDPHPPKPEPGYLDLSSDGKTFIGVRLQPPQKRSGPLTVTGWDAITGKRLFNRTRGPADFGVVMSPDARLLAASQGSGGDGGPKEPGGKGPTRVEELSTGKHVLTLPTLEGQTWPIAFSPDGRLLVTNTWGPIPAGLEAPDSGRQMDTLRLWEIASGAELLVLPGGSSVHAVAFSRDGRVLAFSGPSQDIRLWDLRRSKELRRLTGFGADVTSLAFSPDGSRLVSGLSDSTLLVWDLADTQSSVKTVGLSEKEAMQAWKDLAGDAKTAFAARGTLAESPEKTVTMFKRALSPVRPANAQQLRQSLADVDSEVFAVREAAQKELAAIGELAAPALNEALRGEPTPEARRRMQALLDKLQGPVTQPELLRALRATAVLEDIATPDGRKLLEQLAAGAPEARPTIEAKAALERLNARSAKK